MLIFMKTRAKKQVNNFTLFILLSALALTFFNNFIFPNVEITFLRLAGGINLAFKADSIAILFSTLAVAIWLLVGIYSFEYMTHSIEEKRFFAFYLITLGAVLGVCYSANLVTMYMFFELASLSSYALVIHERKTESLLAGRKFIYYSIFGASLGLIYIIYTYMYAQSPEFTIGGLAEFAELSDHSDIIFLTFLAVVGFGCKAGLFPLHSWLPTAHPVAPAPASAILSGLITKAGVIAIIRVIYYSTGSEILADTWAQYALIGLSLLTILMGSSLAFREKVLKKRLAYSSVSQVSYVLLGLFLLNETAFSGALLQSVFHALAKNLLFISVGAIIFKTGISRADEVEGLGSSAPDSFAFFALGSLSLVGIPLTAGFVSKWELAQGALEFGTVGLVAVSVVIISAMLTAAYLFPIVMSAFFSPNQSAINGEKRLNKTMFAPMFCLCVGIIFFGIYAVPLANFVENIAKSLGI